MTSDDRETRRAHAQANQNPRWWRLVPVSAEPAMLEAAHEYLKRRSGGREPALPGAFFWVEAWDAMLAAAPPADTVAELIRDAEERGRQEERQRQFILAGMRVAESIRLVQEQRDFAVAALAGALGGDHVEAARRMARVATTYEAAMHRSREMDRMQAATAAADHNADVVSAVFATAIESAPT